MPLVPGGTLRYEYRVKVTGSRMAFLFYYGTDSTSMPVNLPLGRTEYHMINIIEFSIIDGINDPVIVERNVTVRFPNTMTLLSFWLSYLFHLRNSLNKWLVNGS